MKHGHEYEAANKQQQQQQECDKVVTQMTVAQPACRDAKAHSCGGVCVGAGVVAEGQAQAHVYTHTSQHKQAVALSPLVVVEEVEGVVEVHPSALDQHQGPWGEPLCPSQKPACTTATTIMTTTTVRQISSEQG